MQDDSSFRSFRSQKKRSLKFSQSYKFKISTIRIFPSSVYPTFAIFRMPQIMGYNYDSANYAGQFVREFLVPWLEGGNQGKMDRNGSGGDARFYNNGRIVSKSGVTGGVPPSPPSSRENAPAYFQSSNLNQFSRVPTRFSTLRPFSRRDFNIIRPTGFVEKSRYDRLSNRNGNLVLTASVRNNPK